MIGKRKPEIKITRDGRLILTGTAYFKMKLELRNLAENKCEECGKFTLHGDVDHVRGRSAGKRDDKIFNEQGERVLRYLCRGCHSGRHVPDKVIPAKPTEAEFRALLGLK